MNITVSENFEFTIDRSNDFLLFVCLVFETLETVELPYRPIKCKSEYEKYGLHVPKTKLEIVKLDFDHKTLWKKIKLWALSKAQTLSLDVYEFIIFRKAIDYAYDFTESSEWQRKHSVIGSYYRKYFYIHYN